MKIKIWKRLQNKFPTKQNVPNSEKTYKTKERDNKCKVITFVLPGIIQHLWYMDTDSVMSLITKYYTIIINDEYNKTDPQ